MATKTTTKKVETKVVEEKPLKVTIEFPDGTSMTQELYARQFKPNTAGGFQNTGYQCRINAGYYTGSIMVIDGLKQVKL